MQHDGSWIAVRHGVRAARNVHRQHAWKGYRIYPSSRHQPARTQRLGPQTPRGHLGQRPLALLTGRQPDGRVEIGRDAPGVFGVQARQAHAQCLDAGRRGRVLRCRLVSSSSESLLQK